MGPGEQPLSVDYNWKIKNEVKTLSTDQLLLAEYQCRNGLPNNTSASCQNVTDWVSRDAGGNLARVYTPKLNVASQNLEAVTVGAVPAGPGPLRFADVLGQLHQHAEA